MNPIAARLSEASVVMEGTQHPELAEILRIGAEEIGRVDAENERRHAFIQRYAEHDQKCLEQGGDNCICGYHERLMSLRAKLPNSRPVVNPPADQAEARNRDHAAPWPADPNAPRRGETGASFGTEARPVIATEHDPDGRAVFEEWAHKTFIPGMARGNIWITWCAAVKWAREQAAAVNLEVLLGQLYDSEINCEISSFWDGRWTVKLGDRINGYKAEAEHLTLEEAALWLALMAYEFYPSSVFARALRGKPPWCATCEGEHVPGKFPGCPVRPNSP